MDKDSLKDLTLEQLQAGEVFLMDKPLGWTSFQAVNKLRHVLCRHFGVKKIKIGHAGTLDPLATGLLIICAGTQTKSIPLYQAGCKEYIGTLVLGATTPSYDLETEIESGFPTGHITREDILTMAAKFTGEILQAPPVFSAIQKDGKRMYEHARAGRAVEMEKRPVEIFEFEITDIRMPEVDFRVVCSKGTYIRSLAHDFGIALGSRAYLSALRRTRIGDFGVEGALSPQEYTECFVPKAFAGSPEQRIE